MEEAMNLFLALNTLVGPTVYMMSCLIPWLQHPRV